VRSERVPLGRLISSVSGRAGKNSSLPVYSVTKHRGFVPSVEYFKKQVFAKDLSTYKVVEPDQFAYATIHLDEGSIGFAPESCLVSPMYTVFAVDDSLVDRDYLFAYLKSPRALASYANIGRGSAERRRSISLEALSRLTIPLPPLPEQRRIASILDRAAAIVSSRVRQLDQVDELEQGLYRSVQRDVAESNLAWSPLSALVTHLSSGKSIVGNEDDAGEFRVLKISAVTSGKFRSDQAKPLPAGYVPLESHLVYEGDTLMSRANTAALVGASAMVLEPTFGVALPDKLWRLEWRDEYRPFAVFLWQQLRSPAVRAALTRKASGSGGAMKNLSQSDVLELELVFPPEATMRLFQEKWWALTALRSSIAHHREKAETLRVALQARAFRGEL
jgi:type I restriction enzyme S subunit